MWDVWGVLLGMAFVGFALISHFTPRTSHFHTNYNLLTEKPTETIIILKKKIEIYEVKKRKSEQKKEKKMWNF